jgi:hypothetical protein
MSPPWYLYLAMAAIGIFDAFAGVVAATLFVGGSMLVLAFTGGLADLGGWRVFIGVALSLFGPAFLITGFRSLRRKPEASFAFWWERIADFLICAFLAGWLLSSVAKTLPALAGHTMAVANHVQDFALIAAVAAIVRVLLEDLAVRAYPRRSGWHSQIRVPNPNPLSKTSGLVFKFALWSLIASAMFGFNWQIALGVVLFLAPSVLNIFASRLPNSKLIWKIMPSGLPGMALSLFLASASASGVALLIGSTPEVAKLGFMLMPIPLLIPGVLKEFGRNGGPGAVRPSRKNKWVYRIGGVVVYLVTLKLAGVI